jgi:hypothetical protein
MRTAPAPPDTNELVNLVVLYQEGCVAHLMTMMFS